MQNGKEFSTGNQPQPTSIQHLTAPKGHNMTNKTLSDRMNWRYATKKMDPAKSVSQDKVDAIIEAVRMAPTSSGTQPFELFVITNPEVRARIQEAASAQIR